jgi:hypothetical protein
MSTTTARNWLTALEQSTPGWTENYPRPTERDGFDPRALASYQSKWDRADGGDRAGWHAVRASADGGDTTGRRCPWSERRTHDDEAIQRGR